MASSWFPQPQPLAHTTPTLMWLPPEVRLKIYRLLWHGVAHEASIWGFSPAASSAYSAALLQTCQVLCRDARAHFYQLASFKFEFCSLASIERRIGGAGSLIKHVALDGCELWARKRDFLALFPNLESLQLYLSTGRDRVMLLDDKVFVSSDWNYDDQVPAKLMVLRQLQEDGNEWIHKLAYNDQNSGGRTGFKVTLHMRWFLRRNPSVAPQASMANPEEWEIQPDAAPIANGVIEVREWILRLQRLDKTFEIRQERLKRVDVVDEVHLEAGSGFVMSR